MKTFIFLLFILIPTCSFAQIDDLWQKRDTMKRIFRDTLQSDSEMKILPGKEKSTLHFPLITVEKESDSQNSRRTEINIFGSNNYKKNRKSKDGRNRSFQGHWEGFYYGFINMAKTDYSMYAPEQEGFMELDWAGSFALQFNLYDYSINLVPRNNFGMVVGVGLEYQRMRFEDKRTSITMVDGKVTPFSLPSIGIDNIRRSSFKTFYLTIPLLFEVQFPAKYKHNLYLSGGVMAGVRMHSKTKVVYDDGGKEKRKEKDSFNMIPFKADAIGRIGYRNISVWGSYTMTRLFKSGGGPELHPYTIGIGLGF